jgi:hypothetical protein
MITKVASFKTSDGALHADKVSAIDREYFLELRGLVNGVTPRGSLALNNTEIATMIKTHAKCIKEILTKYEYSLNRAMSESGAVTKK